MSDIAAFLQEKGCFETKHSGQSLGEHLLGTAQLLELVGAEPHVVLAGALHSIYGTAAFTKRTLGQSERAEVAARFGAKAERLAHIFCSVAGAACIENAPDGGGAVPNRITGEEIYLSSIDVEDLRLISAANLLEQDSPSLSKFPKTIKLFESKMAEMC